MGTHARDKDAVAAVMALCEAAAYYRSKGLTLCQEMRQLFEKYGYFQEGLRTVARKGIQGAKEMRDLMERIRSNPPRKIGEYQVKQFRDYKKGTILDYETGKTFPSGQPESDVLYFDLEDDAWCCVRPSGTEPKVKFYMGVKGISQKDAEERLKRLAEAVDL